MAEGVKTGGRCKGTPNKSTANAKAAIGAFVDNNTARLQSLLDTIEEKQGAQAAWDCIMDLIEYHVPKLQRTEVTGLDGGALSVELSSKDAKL